MGNCQAVDAAVLVIQHPCGKIDRLYWPVSASEVMKTNPGHYVSLIIPLPLLPQEQIQEQNQEQKTVKFTRVKLLRPNETLNLGHAYRLITNQEVMKVLKAKKHAKSKKTHEDAVLQGYETKKGEESDQGNTYQGIMNSREAEQRDTSKEEGLQILLLYRGQNPGAPLYKASQNHQKFNNENH